MPLTWTAVGLKSSEDERSIGSAFILSVEGGRGVVLVASFDWSSSSLVVRLAVPELAPSEILEESSWLDSFGVLDEDMVM